MMEVRSYRADYRSLPVSVAVLFNAGKAGQGAGPELTAKAKEAKAVCCAESRI